MRRNKERHQFKSEKARKIFNKACGKNVGALTLDGNVETPLHAIIKLTRRTGLSFHFYSLRRGGVECPELQLQGG